MRRGAVLEALEQEAELLVRLLRGQAHDLEHALLHVPTVDADGTAADLVAVAHDVVRVGQGRARVGVEGVRELRLGRGERVVHGGPGARAHGDVARGHGVGRRLEHRRVHDPHERPVGVLRGHAVTGVGEQPAATADLHAGRTQQRAGLLRLPGGEEHAVARVRAHGGGQPGLLLLGDVLGHRAGQLAVLLDEHVGQALGAALLGPLLPRVEGAAGLGGAARHHDGAHVLVLEHAERGVLEVLGQVRQLEAEAQVRLVRAVLLHRLGVGHAADRRRHVHAHEGPQGLDDLLAEGDHVVLLHEGGLDVQLGELGLTVRAEVLVAVAAGDLVVLLDPAHLQQLLEQLR